MCNNDRVARVAFPTLQTKRRGVHFLVALRRIIGIAPCPSFATSIHRRERVLSRLLAPTRTLRSVTRVGRDSTAYGKKSPIIEMMPVSVVPKARRN